MAIGMSEEKLSSPSFLDVNERAAIERKVTFELNEMQFKMIKIGGLTNIISGIFVVWFLYQAPLFTILMSWYGILVFLNLCNIAFSYYFSHSKVTPEKIKPWLISYHILLGLICLTWGSVGVFIPTESLQNHVYILAFLLAVIVGFAVGTVTDIIAVIISVTFLLFPYVTFHLYVGISSLLTSGHDPNLNIGFSIIFLILGLFLLITCFIGNRLIKKSFVLSFENMALSKKLENMNRFLEQRVKERTHELEESLNLVTYQATHDLLTDLPNQRLLLEYLQKSIVNATNENRMFCVIFFSLNEIEKINDGLGHHVGDFLIKTIAERFKETFSLPIKTNSLTYTVTLSRKDVFVVILEPIFNLNEIETKAEELFKILEEPICTENQVIKLTASIGISIYPRNGKEVTSLLMNADAAMLRAKQFGGNSLNMYKSEINADISKKLEIESNLHNALANSEFMLQYQPFVDLKTGLISGAEALVRWKNPSLGFIPPDNFIPLAEANGIIIPLGEWVLRTACLQTKQWHDLGLTHLKIAVNLSAKQLHQKNIVQVIEDILKETKLDPKYLELELTETEAFQTEIFPIIRQFKSIGLSLSIDDFGTGYSGLSNLKKFDIDKLKIDKSFVQDVVTNIESKAIVSNTIGLAKKLDIQILAEGVETAEQLHFLKENSCDLIQGYFFSPPVNVDVFTKLLSSNTRFKI